MKKIVFLIPMIFVLFLFNCSDTQKVKPKPKAAFSADPRTINAGQTVYFTDESQNNPSVWVWDFGDGSDYSTVQNPSHTYTVAGTYDVILGVSNDKGDEDILTKSSYITVNEVGNPPVAAFYADPTNIGITQWVQFTDQSTNEPTSWSWNFGDGGTSTQQNPSHQYNTAGNYNVSLSASNSFGQDSETKNNLISVSGIAAYNVTFNNPIFTDIVITCYGSTKTITPGSSVTFYNILGSSVSYSAYTSGKTSGGTQVGLKLTWNNTVDLTVDNNYTLIVSDDYFFLYLRNYGTHVLTNLYVNYGLVPQTYDNIIVPHDNVNYSIGYYKAFTNTNVRMYYQDVPASYVYWNQGSNFTLPWTDNQKAELWNSFKKSSIKGSPVDIDLNAGLPIAATISNTEFVFDQKSIKQYCK